MSRRGAKGQKLAELKLRLSPPGAGGGIGRHPGPASPSRSPSEEDEEMEASTPRSCVSSESAASGCGGSPEATSMVLVGCPRCLMYVMVAETQPRCPQCKSSVLLDLEATAAAAAAAAARKPNR